MTGSHCSIHGKALAVRKMPEEVGSVLDAVKVVNYIKACPVNVLCNEMGSDHVELRWLSRGKEPTTFFEKH